MKRPVIGARSSFTRSTMDRGRAHQFSSARRSVGRGVTPFAPGDPSPPRAWGPQVGAVGVAETRR